MASTTAFTASSAHATTPQPAFSGAPGAAVPFTEYSAANASTNGVVTAASRAFTQLAAEATGRRAVQLAANQYVEFVLTRPANAVDIRYSVPDGSADSALRLTADGRSLATTAPLTTTARYSHFYGNYPFTKNPADGGEHHYFDDTRALFAGNHELPAGTRVRITAAQATTVDVADFEDVAAPQTRTPAGALSVLDFGADPTGAADSSQAIQNAIDAGSAQQKTVWIPPGTYTVTRHLTVDDVTVQGAGPWYSVLHGAGVGVFGNAAPTPSTAVHLSGFAIFGETTIRDDSVSDSGIGGSLGGGSTVDDLWVQHTKAGMWLDGPADGLTISDSRIQDTTADGVNLHDGVSHVTVRNTFVRNTGDDGMAMWSDQNADHDDAFVHDTVVEPQLANGFAVYGGHDNAVQDDLAADTVTQGGGVHVGNRFGSVPLAGTTTIAGNLLLRTGDLVANAPTEIAALWFDAADSPMTGAISVHDDTIVDSSYAAIQFVGKSITGIRVDRVAIAGAGTFAVQLQAPGSAAFSDVAAFGLGASGTYDCASGFAITKSGADFGWDRTACGFPPNGTLAIDKADGVDFGFQALNTGSTQPVVITNPGPKPITVQRIAAPAGFTADDPCGTIAVGASCTVHVGFDPAVSGNFTGLLTIDSTSPAGPYVVGLKGVGYDPNGDLALGRTATSSSQQCSWCGPDKLTDGDPGTYFESQDGTFPQTVTVDLGQSTSVDRVVLKLPPNWGARTETLSVAADGAPLVASASYTFDPATGNAVTIAVPATVLRTLTLTVTGNTGWPAAQLSEVEIYAH
ncbi:glycosyl hydrolase family 28-related protein [Catenulispora sp. EB89]|uniref:glycosyl hydrolase family 28-related protein n=1 Tax=Catenulispora sp. EB89 TaxID=3156257 RepID=UPI003518B8E5